MVAQKILILLVPVRIWREVLRKIKIMKNLSDNIYYSIDSNFFESKLQDKYYKEYNIKSVFRTPAIKDCIHENNIQHIPWASI